MTESDASRPERDPGAHLAWDADAERDLETDVEPVRAFFRAFEKAMRAAALYDRTNPVYQRFVANLREGFASLWQHVDRLSVKVEESRLLVDGQEVYANDHHAESLAFLFYKDGVREFSILPGIEGVELEPFLKVLHRARHAGPDDDDVITMLWEASLRHFEYRHVEPGLEGVELPEAGPGASAEDLAMVHDAEADAEGGEEAERSLATDGLTFIDPEGFDPTLYALDVREMATLEREVELEMSRDLRRDVLNALFDRLENPEFPEQQPEIVEIFAQLLPSFLSSGALDVAGGILEELHTIERRGQLPVAVRGQITDLLDTLSAPDALNELVKALEDGTLNPEPRDLAEFLSHLRAFALGPLLKAAESVVVREIRPVLRDAVKGIAQRYPEALVSLVRDPDPVVVTGAVRLIGGLQVAGAAESLARLMEHPEVSVRLAAIDSAMSLRTATVASALQSALRDPQRDVRIAAVRALVQLRYAAAEPGLRAIVTGREIRDRDRTEKIAFFEAYGELAGADAIPILEKILRASGGLLSRAEPPEIRACAALALGRIATPQTDRLLIEFRNESDPVIRSAVGRALRGGDE